MNDNKRFSDLSTEELLAQLEGNKEPSIIKPPISTSLPVVSESITLPSIYSFVEAFGIKNGTYMVRTKILFELYKLWYPDYGNMNINAFSKELGNYILPPKKRSTRSYYSINVEMKMLLSHIEGYKKVKHRGVNTNKNDHYYYEQWFKRTNIKPGPLFVDGDILYNLYDEDRYNKGKRSQPMLKFLKICSLFFETKYLSKSRLPFFGLDPSIQEHITQERVERWRIGRKKFQRKRLHGKDIEEKDIRSVIYPERLTQEQKGS